MNPDAVTMHAAGVACLIVMAALAAWSIARDIRGSFHKILAALRGEPAALGDTAPRIAAGPQRQADRADLAPTPDRIPA